MPVLKEVDRFRIPGYRVGTVLGAGSRGCVVRATREGNAREVALKIIPLSAFDASSSPGTRFGSVMKQVTELEDPMVVKILDYGTTDRYAYIAQELVEEGTLAHRLAGGEPVDLERALRLCIGVSQALECAHAHGLCHGDLKPSNVLVPSWEHPVVMDFGLLAILRDDRILLATNAMIGSWIYFAPERRLLDPVNTPRGDVFALGALLALLATGQEPYDIHNQSVRDALTAGIPDRVVEVINKATHYEPQERYADASSFRSALSQIADQMVGKAARGRRDQLTLAEEAVLGVARRGGHAAPSLSEGDMVLIVAEPRASEQPGPPDAHISGSQTPGPRGPELGRAARGPTFRDEARGGGPSAQPARASAPRLSTAKVAAIGLMSLGAPGVLLYRWAAARTAEPVAAEPISESEAPSDAQAAPAEPEVAPNLPDRLLADTGECVPAPSMGDEEIPWQPAEPTGFDARTWERLCALPGM